MTYIVATLSMRVSGVLPSDSHFQEQYRGQPSKVSTTKQLQGWKLGKGVGRLQPLLRRRRRGLVSPCADLGELGRYTFTAYDRTTAVSSSTLSTLVKLWASFRNIWRSTTCLTKPGSSLPRTLKKYTFFLTKFMFICMSDGDWVATKIFLEISHKYFYQTEVVVFFLS